MQGPFTPKPTTSTLGGRKRLFQNIRTLDPSKLVEDDYIDFSLKPRPTLRVILQPHRSTESPGLMPLSPRGPTFDSGASWSSKRYPPDTRGFMYYHVPPNGSPLAGELRFRLTPSRDPTSFASGSDLLTDCKMPWRYPLYKIVCRADYGAIVALLRQDDLVSQRTLDLVTAAVAPLHPGLRREGVMAPMWDARHRPTRVPAAPVLSAFGQEFAFRYAPDLNFCGVFASQDSILMHNMRHITTFSRFRVPVEGKYVGYSPFKGSVVCCFERSTLPDDTGRRVAVIRVKRMIESDPIRSVPAPDGRSYPEIEALRPREGELLKTATYGQVRPWAVDVDRPWSGSKGKHTRITPWKGLRVLFDNEELYGSPPES